MHSDRYSLPGVNLSHCALSMHAKEFISFPNQGLEIQRYFLEIGSFSARMH